jgi:hypothetical protein
MCTAILNMETDACGGLEGEVWITANSACNK